MKDWNPNGFMLSNGPGDPNPLKEAQEVAKEIIKESIFVLVLLLPNVCSSSESGAKSTIKRKALKSRSTLIIKHFLFGKVLV